MLISTYDLGGLDTVFLRSEALAAGVNDQTIARLVRSGEWHRVRRGAYVSGELWRRLDEADRHRVRARAVLRVAHSSAALCHASAAVELGAPVWDVDLSEVHLVRTDGRTGRREAGVVRHGNDTAEEDVQVRNGVRLVSGTRAAIEMCTIASTESALVTVDGLLHARETTIEALWAMAAHTDHWPDSQRTQIVLRLADARRESAGESRTSYLCWTQHLPRPEPQFVVLDEHGHEVARLDFAWPEYGVFLEFDGRQKYAERLRGDRTLEEVLLAERRREELVCRLTGWVCIRITWEDLARPEATARRIAAVLASRGRRPA